jgi:hypothetical protein
VPIGRTLGRALVLATAFAAVAAAAAALAENVDPQNNNSQFAWGENVGWINAEPNVAGNPGVHVTGTDVTGYMWGENLGWINMSCKNNSTCGTTGNYGVENDGAGNLSGYAWGENVGWISFACDNNPSSCGSSGDYGVAIDPATGDWSGYAWGENIGWISFADTAPHPYKVTTDDGDGIAGASDNCPFDANVNQVNTDVIVRPPGDAFGDDCDHDDDNDGCYDVDENGTMRELGGDRNSLDFWDFYDVTGDRAIDLSDALAILGLFGVEPDMPEYIDSYDRYSPNAPKPWRTAKSIDDFGIDLTDALTNLDSFGDGCDGLP